MQVQLGVVLLSLAEGAEGLLAYLRLVLLLLGEDSVVHLPLGLDSLDGILVLLLLGEDSIVHLPLGLDSQDGILKDHHVDDT